LRFRARGISPVRGAPRWCALSGEEQRCGARGVIGARVGRVVEVHRRGVEHEEATVGQRGGQRGRCLKGGAHRRDAPFKAVRGGGRGGGNSGRQIWWVVRRRPWSRHGWHGRRHGSDWAADGWAPTVLIFLI
jgi:hypothetical protein